MDGVDYLCTGQALEYARDNQIVRWSNPEANTDYRIEPLKRYERRGRVCRDFVSERDYKGRTKKKRYTACRKEDGVWRIE